MNFVKIKKPRKSDFLVKVTRLVVLRLKEMVTMVCRRGSESKIKSDLGISAKSLFLKKKIQYIFV